MQNPYLKKLQKIPDGDLSIFLRIGSDFTDNYYEYEIPLKVSDLEYLKSVKNDLLVYSEGVWLKDNAFDFPLHILTDLKEERNKVSGAGSYYSKADPEKQSNTITVKGNPNLGYVKGLMIGIRNKQGGIPRCGEVWVNELRMTGFDERGGVAAVSRIDFQLADLGTLPCQEHIRHWDGVDWISVYNKGPSLPITSMISLPTSNWASSYPERQE